MTADTQSITPSPETPLGNQVEPSPPTVQSSDNKDQESLNEIVHSIVDDLVQNVVFTASLREEKKKVQGLINSLVTRVRDEAKSDAATRDTSPANNNSHADAPSTTTAPLPPKAMSGVPFGDHRPRHVASLPVTWMQTMDSITLTITVPSWVRKQNVSVTFTHGSVRVTVARDQQSPPVIAIDEPLIAKIDTESCTWALQDAGKDRDLTLELEKACEQWWARLFMSDDPELYTIVEPSRGSPCSSRSEEQALPTGSPDVEAKKDIVRDVSRSLNTSDVAQSPDESPSERGPNPLTNNDAKGHSLEETVEAVLGEVVESVAKPGVERKATTTADVSSRASSFSHTPADPQPQKKILTKADLLKLVEQYKEEFKKGGPGAAEAAMQLATFYHHGIGVEKDDAQAAPLYKFGLENGVLDPSAAFQLGIIYNSGTVGMEPNPTEAVRWWQVSASLGNSVAMFNLGVMAMNGSGCEMDPVAALQWWQKATSLNPQLRPPHFTQTQIEERMVTAAKQRKERQKAALPPEERKRRRDEALEKARVVGYTSAGLLALGLSVVAIRYWWRNRL